MSNKIPEILRHKWSANEDHVSHIDGLRVDEGRAYTITCPSDLRDEIVKMQNFMVDRYREIEEKLQALQKAKLEWYEASRKYDMDAPRKIKAKVQVGNADDPFTLTSTWNDSEDPYIKTGGLDDGQ